MKNTIRCCISCILPCGALDVIRIVHTNGRVEEISGSIRAADVMNLHPKHVLKKPSSCSAAADGIGVAVPKIVIVPPDAELRRGKIYFLMPLPPDSKAAGRSKKRKDHRIHHRSSLCSDDEKNVSYKSSYSMSLAAATDVLLSADDRYLSEIMSEKVSASQRSRGRAGVWRPHLESISETTSFLNIPADHDDSF